MTPPPVALDTNVLVYAELEPSSPKGLLSRTIIERTAPVGVIPVQALLEFVAVVRRRRPQSLASATAKVAAWSEVFITAPTTVEVMEGAGELVMGHGFQVWDAVIWTAARSAGAHTLVTEDMQDGLRLSGLVARDPFACDQAALESLFAGFEAAAPSFP